MTPSGTERGTRAWVPLSAVAAAVLALHLATNGRYGWFRDELYFLACGQRLAWGYVDQPPLIALFGRIATSLFGMSLSGVRLFPALAATGLVVLTGAFARRLGGGAFAMALAGLAAGLAPTFLVGGHLFTMNAFEPLVWTGCAWGVVSLVDAPRPRAWLALGALLGVGLLNKYSVGFFAVCLVLGLLLSRERRALRSPWLLASISLCVLLVLPNILWQRSNGWPMLELLRNGQLNKNTPFDAGAFLANQVLQLNPLALPLWLGGLWFLLRREEGRRYRALGFAFLLNLSLFIAMRAKAYYLAPAYPMLLASGAVLFERLVPKPALRWAASSALVATGLLIAPVAIPALPPETLIRYQAALGVTPSRDERKAYNPLAQHLADQFGWPELVRTVEQAARSLPEHERAGAVVFAQNYGEAAALELLGEGRVPPVLSGHNNYFLWGQGRLSHGPLLVLGPHEERLREICSEVALVATTPDQPHAMPYENQLPIYLCRGLRLPPEVLWSRVRHFE